MTSKAADSVEHLRGTQGIRKRPSMYIGGIDRAGMAYAVGEAISNSVDQFLLGYATLIRVDIADNGRTVSVADDGVGLPFDVASPDSRMPLASQYLTDIHATPTADNHAPHVHFLQRGGAHGVGIVALNALCETFICRSWRGGRQWTQSFSRGIADAPAEVIAEGDGRGTELRFKLDREIFGDLTIDLSQLRSSLIDRVHLFDGLCIELNGERLFAERGLATLAESISQSLQMDTTSWGDRPAFHMNETYDDMIIHAAAFGVAHTTTWRAWANCRVMPHGGTHQSAFSDAMGDYSWTPAVGLIHVMMKDPEFTGSSIERLNVPQFRDSIASRIREKLVAYCREFQIPKTLASPGPGPFLSPLPKPTHCRRSR